MGAVGVPIVTSRLPGNVEALSESYAGYFESESDLPSLMLRVLRDPEMATLLGNANRARCRSEFSQSKMAEQYLRFYDSVFTQ